MGGTAILWKQSLNAQDTPCLLDNSRVCAVTVNIAGKTMMLFSVYMPVDRCYGNEDSDEFNEVLNCVRVASTRCNADSIIVAGDFNTDFSRERSVHTRLLRQFIQEECLLNCTDATGSSVKYSFESKIVNSSRSLVDHFLVTEDIFNMLQSCSTVDYGHKGACTITITANVAYTETCPDEEYEVNRLNWGKTSSQELES